MDGLREALGDHHDLHVLAGFAAKRGGLEPEAMEALADRVAARQKKLRRRAKIEFDRLFAETPNAFAARLAAYLARPVMKPGVESEAAAEAKEPPTA